jgi:hypothetical protein
MYKIIKENNIITFIDNPIFIKQLSNGNYTPTEKRFATGIVIDNEIYTINGNAIEGKESVVIEEINNGTKFYEVELIQDNMDELLIDQEYRITLLELGVTE